MKIWISNIIFVLLCLLLPLSFTLGNAMLLSYTPATYQKLLFQNNDISLSQTDRKILADALYKGITKHVALQIQLENGKSAFSEKEIIHMQDVSRLIENLLLLTILFLLISGFLLGWFYRQKKKLLIYLPLISVILSLIFLVLVLLNFSFCFTFFHELVFHNNFWLMDASKDLLINLFPLSFFVIQFIKIGVITLLELVLLFFGLKVLKK
jgi:integral membrane protein (TIGR01906 family)